MARNVEFNEEEAIRKAMLVFWEKGYNGTSLRELTEAMQINSSSLYNTIGDKSELYIRCITHYTDERRSDIRKRMAADAPAFEKLVDYINDSIKVITDGRNGCMAIKAAFEMGNDNPRVKDILKQDSEHADRFLTSLIAKAMEEGDIPKDEDPKLIADYFISTWTGWYESFILHKDAEKIRKMAKYFIRQISR
jgi:TetR/AcrR family transcriptional regulator, transcriptional repressor for nem operon